LKTGYNPPKSNTVKDLQKQKCFLRKINLLITCGKLRLQGDSEEYFFLQESWTSYLDWYICLHSEKQNSFNSSKTKQHEQIRTR